LKSGKKGEPTVEFILIVALLLGVIPGMIAHSKGHSFIAWWMYGAALFSGLSVRCAGEGAGTYQFTWTSSRAVRAVSWY
jgi:hypothetical protein